MNPQRRTGIVEAAGYVLMFALAMAAVAYVWPV